VWRGNRARAAACCLPAAGALVSGNKLRFSKKKFTFSPLFRGSLWKLITHHHCCRGYGESFRQACAPRVGAHDVILTGLDEEGDSTDDEMPPLEPLEGAAQLGVVWLRGHGKDGCDPTTSAKLALQLRATQLGGPQAGGAQLGGPHLDVGLID